MNRPRLGSTAGIRARAMAEAAWRHDYERKATPINADDGAEKARRIQAALTTCTDPSHRSLMMRELGRLQWLLATEK